MSSNLSTGLSRVWLLQGGGEGYKLGEEFGRAALITWWGGGGAPVLHIRVVCATRDGRGRSVDAGLSGATPSQPGGGGGSWLPDVVTKGG